MTGNSTSFTRILRLGLAVLALALVMAPAGADPMQAPDAERDNAMDLLTWSQRYTSQTDNLSCAPEAYGGQINPQVYRSPVGLQAQDIGIGRGTCFDLQRRSYYIEVWVAVEAYYPGQVPDWKVVDPGGKYCQTPTPNQRTDATAGLITTRPVATPVCTYGINGANVGRAHRAHVWLKPVIGGVAQPVRETAVVWYLGKV